MLRAALVAVLMGISFGAAAQEAARPIDVVEIRGAVHLRRTMYEPILREGRQGNVTVRLGTHAFCGLTAARTISAAQACGCALRVAPGGTAWSLQMTLAKSVPEGRCECQAACLDVK